MIVYHYLHLQMAKVAEKIIIADEGIKKMMIMMNITNPLLTTVKKSCWTVECVQLDTS